MDPPPLCLFCNTQKMNSANTTIFVFTKCNITILSWKLSKFTKLSNNGGVKHILGHPLPSMTVTKHKKIMNSAYSTISVFKYTTGLYMKTANVKKIIK